MALKLNVKVSQHVHALASQYLLLKSQADQLDKKMTKVRDEVRTLFPQCSPMKDEKGNRNLEIGTIFVQMQKRVSVKLDNDKAVEFATKKKILDKVTHTEVIADMDSFEQLFLADEITQREMDALIIKKETEALIIQPSNKKKKKNEEEI